MQLSGKDNRGTIFMNFKINNAAEFSRKMIMPFRVIRFFVDGAPAISNDQAHIKCRQVGRKVSSAHFLGDSHGRISQWLELIVDQMAMPGAHVDRLDIRWGGIGMTDSQLFNRHPSQIKLGFN